MFNYQTVRDVDVNQKTILLRADYNVPLDGDSQIVDDLRIRASLPTLEYLLSHGAQKIIIISHLGRPAGVDDQFSLRPIAQRLQQLLPDTPVAFASQVSGAEVSQAVQNLPAGGILLLENLRFWASEKQNDAQFAKNIVDSTGADLFVQDGFAVVHRAHASTSAITQFLPSVAGLLLEKEVTTLTQVLQSPAHPFYVIIGGSKVADKQPLITKFVNLADEIWVGGKIAADGYQPEGAGADKIHVITTFKEDAAGHRLDISAAAADELAAPIRDRAATVLWNGVLGQVEDPAYAAGSETVALAIGKKTQLTSVICGGDTTAFVENLQKTHPDLHYTLISTGGGAALALLAGEPLPGLASLTKA